MIDPRTLRPTTVSIASQYCHSKVKIRSELSRVKIILGVSWRKSRWGEIFADK